MERIVPSFDISSWMPSRSKPVDDPKTVPVASMSGEQIASLSIARVAAFTAEDAESLTKGKLAHMSGDQIGALSADAFKSLGRGKVASLRIDQIAALSGACVAKLTRGKLAMLSPEQIAAIDPAAFASLGGHKLASLSAAQMSALTLNQLNALKPGQVVALISAAVGAGAIQTMLASHGGAWSDLKRGQILRLSSATLLAMNDATFSKLFAGKYDLLPGLTGLTPARLNALSPAEFAKFLGAELNQLGGAVLSRIKQTLFTPDQISQLGGNTIAHLSADFLRGLSAQGLAAIAPSAIAGLSVAQMQGLSEAQLAAFTPAQIAAMSANQHALVAAIRPLVAEAISLETNGVFTAASAVTLLEHAAVGGLTGSELKQLKDVANALSTASDAVDFARDDAIIATAPVVALFHNVVLGGPSHSKGPALGNLPANATQADVEHLIDKWFRGGDLPALEPGSGGYANSGLPLFGPSGAPSVTDIRQGAVNDSALLAGIAETVLQRPGYIQSLLTDNGNGVYAVEFPDLFTPSYVTVNSLLPTNGGGAAYSDKTGEWVALLEKAAAQHGGGASYASLEGGDDDALALFSGQMMNSWTFRKGEQNHGVLLSTVAKSFAAGENVVIESGNHYLAVTGIDANGSADVYDPMKGTYGSVTLGATGDDTVYWGITGRATP